MITIEGVGDYKATEMWLKKLGKDDIFATLARYGQIGVAALESATPRESGETARSWYFEVKRDGRSYSIIWGNSNVVAGTPVAILLQYGHGTGTGGYVSGRDFINPALRPIFDQIASEVWEAVKKA